MKLTTPTTLVLLIFFVFVQLTSASWQTTKTDFVLNAQVTKVFPYSTAAVIVRFFVNCSDPCSVNLVNNTEVNKIKNDEPYVSIYSQLTTSASYTDTSFIKNGLSLVIKNKQATDPMNTWVISEQFGATENIGLSTAEQIYIAMGIIAGMTLMGFVLCVLASIGCFLYLKLKPTQIGKNDW